MKRSPLFSFLLLVLLAWSVIGAPALFGQYSDKAFSLRKSSELYDERGYQQSKSVSVDGKLVVANSNGSLSYSYPISSYSAGGYPIQVALNYCNAVSFTAFKQYDEASPSSGGFAGWSRFEQNRPAWILGVNGFAMQMLATNTHFHSDPASAIYKKSQSSFTDKDLIWAADGYDFCNRMIDFGALGYDGNSYVDEIRLLRADGSVLELVNVNGRTQALPDSRPELYTGHYIATEANNSGFGVVSFDSLYWPQYMSDHVEYVSASDRSPLVPRILRYYPGDGLEYLFREWIVPYGTSAYADQSARSGGRYGGPTIFYLEQINGAAGPVASFGRSRHYPVVPGFESGMTWDSTRGRALFTGFDGHAITYGVNSLRIEALGRTTTVRFDRVMPAGNATETNWMPLGMNGYTMAWQRVLAGQPETSSELYRGHIGYVTGILDPEGRNTSFAYQGYTRSYQNYGFPRDATAGEDVTLTTRNLRLSSVVEPLAAYTITYCGDTSATLRYNSTTPSHFETNNVVRSIQKSDRSGTALTRNSFAWSYNGSSVERSVDSLSDLVTGATRSMTYYYRPILLPDLIPGRPQPRFTALYRIDDNSAALSSVTRTRYSSNPDVTSTSAWGRATPIPTPAWGTPYLILPVESTVEVNNAMKSRQTFDYRFDTLRRFGGNRLLTSLFGLEISRRITTTLDPARGQRLAGDTTDYLNLADVDTSFTRLDSTIQKFRMIAEYMRLRRLGEITMSWEEAMYDPRIVSYRVDTFQGRYRVPPHYGLESRQVGVDSGGTILTGRATAYHTAVSPLDQSITVRRGSIAADSTLGSDGTSRLRLAYDYGMMQGRNLPVARRNANGSIARLYYDYALPSLRRAEAPPERPHGMIRDNEDRADSVILTGGEYFGLSLETPLADQQIVRRYQPDRSLRSDTLTQIYRRTFHGLVSGVIDPNGWYSRFDYDRNGRLRTAWLPYDFQGENRRYARALDAERTTEGFAMSSYGVTHDTLYCSDTVNYLASLPTTETISLYDRVYADNPPSTTPKCPPCNQSEKESEEILATCHSAIPFYIQRGAVGTIELPVYPASVESILRLDSAAILLNISSVVGNCVEVKLESELIGFSRTFLFNCPDIDPDDAPTGNREKEGSTITSADSTTMAHDFRIDLTGYRDQIGSMRPGDRLGFRMTMLTSGGRVELLSGANAEDTRPRLWLKGRFMTVNRLADNTLSYDYDDASGSATINQKVDDSLHSSNRIDRLGTLGEARRSQTMNNFGADGRVVLTRQTIGNPRSPSRFDSIRQNHTGSGLRSEVIDQSGGSVITRYDPQGRVLETRFEDSSSAMTAYLAGTPESCGIEDNLQDFHGFCAATITTSESGVTSARYFDAFDRVRREVTDTVGLKLMTRYEYDMAGRLLSVINPGGDTTRYVYDPYGKRSRVRQPDLGTVSYAHDKVGNVRFTQTEQQARDSLMTYNQYDDLNRVTLIGEANFRRNSGSGDHHGKTESGGHSGILSTSTDAPRLSDMVDPNRLNDDGMSSVLTASATLWFDPRSFGQIVPSVWPMASLDSTGCNPGPSALLGDIEWPAPPFLRHPAVYHQPVLMPAATFNDFEHAAKYPHFVRLAISYDTLPAPAGPVWSALPAIADWHRLAPTGKIRNGQGREVAVGYRDHGGEPFHYSMLSYDERGRVEAMIRFTENLGFDAVYYRYNAMNQVISVRSADPFRTNTTWYGYDFNGRVDSIWTAVSPAGTGLSVRTPAYPLPMPRPDNAELVYSYDRSGRTKSIHYPKPAVTMSIGYTPRNWIDSIIAVQQQRKIFAQQLGYDAAGNIVTQQHQHEGEPPVFNRYGYDGASRLVGHAGGADSTSYGYDLNGNRFSKVTAGLGGQSAEHSFYNRAAGPNRLASTHLVPTAPSPHMRTLYSYDGDGAVRRIESRDMADRLLSETHLDYSYRELTTGHTVGPIGGAARREWRYRFSPSGEREQKRMYHSPSGDSGFGRRYGWIYYQLGGAREALAVFHGQQSSDPTCGSTGRTVRLYPSEYNTFAGGSAIISTSATGVRRYRLTDHLGTPRVTLDSSGKVIARQDYDPFGTPIPDGSGRHRFTGIERDIESALAELGVRMYQSESGRFLSVDPHWEDYRATSPYLYCRDNPLSRIDPTGKWDIEVHVSKDRSKNGYGIAILKDRNGAEVYRFVVRVEGVGGRNRMNRNADTPLGTYDIPNHGTWIRGGSRSAYGPNPRLALDGQSGEIVQSGRTLIRLHGGRQEHTDSESGRPTADANPSLQKTHGCLRTYDGVMKRLKQLTDRLERLDEQEEGGTLTIIDDLVEVDGTYQPAAEATTGP